MNASWRDEFAPHILARGKKYYEEGRVRHIIQYGNRITAHVEGCKDYCVEIDFPGGVPDSWLCTCPYAVKGNCKHKAALLFAIEAGEYVFTEKEDEIDTKDLWEEVVMNTPEDILREELRCAPSLEGLQERLIIRHLRKMPGEMLRSWSSRLLRFRGNAVDTGWIREDHGGAVLFTELKKEPGQSARLTRFAVIS